MTREEVRQAVVNILEDIAPDEDLSSIKDDRTLPQKIVKNTTFLYHLPMRS